MRGGLTDRQIEKERETGKRRGKEMYGKMERNERVSVMRGRTIPFVRTAVM